MKAKRSKVLCVLTLFVLLTKSPILQAQDAGLSFGYRDLGHGYWNEIIRIFNRDRSLSEEQPQVSSGYFVGLDMGFSLSNHARLLPEFSYTHIQSNRNSLAIKQHYWSLGVNLNVYPFGFGTQEHCPAFAHILYGTSWRNGIYFQFSGGGSLLQARNYLRGQLVEVNGEPYAPDIFSVFLGAGVGYDVVIAERFIVSPLLKVLVYPDLELEDYDFAIHGTEILNLRGHHTASMLHASVRLAWVL
ncbi:MAG: hypothetical protein AAF740_00165 [Bacteroidota bacterium]